MRAVAATRSLPSSDPRCLIDLELPVPVPGEHDLLVRVAAVSVNPIDTKIRASLPAEGNPEPRMLDWDAANRRRAHAQIETGSTIGKLVVSNEH